MCDEAAARAALDEYVAIGRDAFADARLTRALLDGSSTTSLHAAAGQRLLDGCAQPSEAFSLREAPTRAFAAALGLGVLSAREVREAASVAGADAAASLGDLPLWGRESADALADVVEWPEWYGALARRSLAAQQAGTPATAGGARAQGGDRRESGSVAYWRWNGQHLVRYMTWEAGKDYDGSAPALLLVHGFAASCEQWERLVYALRAEVGDALPPIYALDLVGFGHSEKPGVSYTQYVWEAQIVDYVLEVMEARDVVLVGNSIGGGLSAGASAYLGSICKGVVLCNTAGVLLEPDEYEEDYAGRSSVRDATLRGQSAKAYSPVPLLGQSALELFGAGIIGLLYSRIPALLQGIYSDRPSNADEAVTFAIEQGASNPGSANVIGSGQKLSENRPLNEVLGPVHGFGGPVLIAQGANDRVSGPARAQERADVFTRMRRGVTVDLIENAGHCPQDDAPELVAKAIVKWWEQVV